MKKGHKQNRKNVKNSSSSRRINPSMKSNGCCDPTRPFVIVGLGNPGNEYENTRHNVGFSAVDRLAATLGVSLEKNRKLHVKMGDTLVEGKRVYLVEPQTFMNQSGSAVRAVLANVRAPHENVFIIYDDVRLPLGSIHMSTESGAAGQKGMKDVFQCLGNGSKFVRMRIGVGSPSSRKDLADFVLERFSDEDLQMLDDAFAMVEKEVLAWLMRVDVETKEEEEEKEIIDEEAREKKKQRAATM